MSTLCLLMKRISQCLFNQGSYRNSVVIEAFNVIDSKESNVTKFQNRRIPMSSPSFSSNIL